MTQINRTLTFSDSQVQDLVGMLASCVHRYEEELKRPGNFAYLRGVDAALRDGKELLATIEKQIEANQDVNPMDKWIK